MFFFLLLQAESTATQAALINKTFKANKAEAKTKQVEAKLLDTQLAFEEALVKSQEARLSAVAAAEGPLQVGSFFLLSNRSSLS